MRTQEWWRGLVWDVVLVPQKAGWRMGELEDLEDAGGIVGARLVELILLQLQAKSVGQGSEMEEFARACAEASAAGLGLLSLTHSQQRGCLADAVPWQVLLGAGAAQEQAALEARQAGALRNSSRSRAEITCRNSIHVTNGAGTPGSRALPGQGRLSFLEPDSAKSTPLKALQGALLPYPMGSTA